MFALGREDVFAVDDLGIQTAMQAIYKLDKTDKKKFRADLLGISAWWSPYRTYARLYLWQFNDNSPEKNERSGLCPESLILLSLISEWLPFSVPLSYSITGRLIDA